MPAQYDLKLMLKEIQDDEEATPKSNKTISQDDIKRFLEQRKKKRKEQKP